MAAPSRVSARNVLAREIKFAAPRRAIGFGRPQSRAHAQPRRAHRKGAALSAGTCAMESTILYISLIVLTAAVAIVVWIALNMPATW
jgi:hypothetical protein